MRPYFMQRLPKWVTALTTTLLLTAVASADHPMLSDELFQARFESFKALGYDPLTAPVEWFRPTEIVPGIGSVPEMEIPLPPEERTVSSSALKAASAWAEAQNSTALLVYHKGRLQYEHYWQSQGRESLFNPQSMSKTVLGMMVGIAIRDGHIHSVNDTVGAYLVEWADDPRGLITIRQLLQMSAGLAQISTSYELTLDNPAVFQNFGTDFIGPILALPLADPPGSKWDYNNNEANLLGVILERASGRRYAEYLSEAIWSPLGLADAQLYMDKPGGEPMFSCCILSRPIDWSQLGILFLQEGNAGGRQIVPAQWVREMQQPAQTNPGYGYQVWLGNASLALTPTAGSPPDPHYASEPFADPATVIFNGYGYQRVWLMPAKDLVIVRAGKSWPVDWDNTVIPNIIFRGTS